MHPLLSILRAAHCRSTHHYFAIDALPLVQTDAGTRLVRQLMRHHKQYLVGAKDPDTRFRDFQNHVVHVADGYWGGAPRLAHKWYDRLQGDLERGEYSRAAYAAGVLSHYFTDPIQPLHTGQSERETVVHRPIEWSICQSYESLLKQWQDDELRIVFQLSEGPGWLGEAILHAARFAHRKYAVLVDTYNLERGIARPPEGLSAESRVVLSELFGLAITGWARVLERAAADVEARSAKPIESTDVMLATILATIRVPDRLWLRRVESKQEQKELQLLIQEYRETGTLTKYLPDEVDVKQRVAKVYASEKEYELRLQAKMAAMTVKSEQPIAKPVNIESISVDPDNVPAVASVATLASEPVTLPFIPWHSAAPRLKLSDLIVDAPSIGAKTAARFEKIGINTVEDFLCEDAQDLSEKIATSWITTDLVRQWQAQAKLMCQLPAMLARDVQLLVGSGYATPELISARDPEALHREILRYSATSAGVRYLRTAQPPTAPEVRTWCGAATQYLATRSSARRVA